MLTPFSFSLAQTHFDLLIEHFIWLAVDLCFVAHISKAYAFLINNACFVCHKHRSRVHFNFQCARNGTRMPTQSQTILMLFVEVDVCYFSRYCSALWNFHVIFKYRE